MPYGLDIYEEVYNRPTSQNDPNRGIYAWGRDDERTEQRTYNMFRDILGRAPTQDEFNQALPYFSGQGGQGEWTGRSYLNQLRNQELNDPNNPNSPYNTRNPSNKLSQYYGDVQGIFQDLLKRGASQDELSHFSQMLATGQADPFTLRSFVSQLPEYTNARDAEFRSNVAKELEGYDTSAFNKQKQNILSYYASQGMPAGTSPSLDYALTDLMGKIAEKRQSFLTNLSANQYQGNKEAARADYDTYLGRSFGTQDWNRNRAAGESDYLRGRLGEKQDYQTQMMDYNNFMGRQNRSRPFNTRDWVNLGLYGANTAASMYGGRGRGSEPNYPTYY